jgi:hypothetical protein
MEKLLYYNFERLKQFIRQDIRYAILKTKLHFTYKVTNPLLFFILLHIILHETSCSFKWCPSFVKLEK